MQIRNSEFGEKGVENSAHIIKKEGHYIMEKQKITKLEGFKEKLEEVKEALSKLSEGEDNEIVVEGFTVIDDMLEGICEAIDEIIEND